MVLIGFSTGAVALGNFEPALALLGDTSMTAVELSALRLRELPGLISALPKLDLRQYSYVSIHAPSSFSEPEEENVVQLLQNVPEDRPIILHPDTIFDFELWRPFGRKITIENMDRRKQVGRSAEELKYFFEKLPDARLCLDLAHVHQFDRTMTEAYRILKTFAHRICQLHVSELDSTGHHYPLSIGTMQAFAEIASMIPAEAAIILESLNPFSGADISAQVSWIEEEARRACKALGRFDRASTHASPSAPVSLLDRTVPA
jgi:hypothetical protein